MNVFSYLKDNCHCQSNHVIVIYLSVLAVIVILMSLVVIILMMVVFGACQYVTLVDAFVKTIWKRLYMVSFPMHH
jgi:hypothetical protein